MNIEQQIKLKLLKTIRSKIMKAMPTKTYRDIKEIRKQVSKELDLLEYKEVYKK